MKKILVLGGGGFIGRNIVENLVNRGNCIVTAADIKEGSNWHKLSNKSKNFIPIIDDFTKKDAFKNFNNSFDEEQ